MSKRIELWDRIFESGVEIGDLFIVNQKGDQARLGVVPDWNHGSLPYRPLSLVGQGCPVIFQTGTIFVLLERGIITPEKLEQIFDAAKTAASPKYVGAKYVGLLYNGMIYCVCDVNTSVWPLLDRVEF